MVAVRAPAPVRTRNRVPVERPTTIYRNDVEWLTVQTTPIDLEDWAIGYLYGEGVINSPSEIRRLVVDEDRGLLWVDLLHYNANPISSPPEYAAPGQNLPVTTDDLLRFVQEMLANAPIYQATGGMHVAMAVRLDSGERIIREDIGRHNAVDKVIGAALREGWPGSQTVLLTSGRISYEMCARMARFGTGIGVSRTAATDQAFDLAVQLGIELVGYARNAASILVYTDAQRVRRGIGG